MAPGRRGRTCLQSVEKEKSRSDNNKENRRKTLNKKPIRRRILRMFRLLMGWSKYVGLNSCPADVACQYVGLRLFYLFDFNDIAVQITLDGHFLAYEIRYALGI